MENSTTLLNVSKKHFKETLGELAFVVIITIPLLVLDDIHNLSKGLLFFIYPNLIYISIFYLLSLRLLFKVYFNETGVSISYIARFWHKTEVIAWNSITELRWVNKTIYSGSANKVIFIINEKKQGWAYVSANDFHEIEALIRSKNPNVLVTKY